MKSSLVFALLSLVSTSVFAAPLTPVTSTSRDCVATVTDATYAVQAVCWKNRDGQNRMWFPAVDLQNLVETGVNTKFIRNVDAACATTNEYRYEDLFGNTAKRPEEIVTKEVSIAYSHLNATACYQ